MNVCLSLLLEGSLKQAKATVLTPLKNVTLFEPLSAFENVIADAQAVTFFLHPLEQRKWLELQSIQVHKASACLSEEHWVQVQRWLASQSNGVSLSSLVIRFELVCQRTNLFAAFLLQTVGRPGGQIGRVSLQHCSKVLHLETLKQITLLLPLGATPEHYGQATALKV